MEQLLAKLRTILAKLPTEIREGLASSKSMEFLHAQNALHRFVSSEGLDNLLRDSGVWSHPPRMQVLVTSASRVDQNDIAIWLVRRALWVGEAAALEELVRFSTANTVVAREVLVLDGVRTREGVELATGIRLEPLTSLQPSFFRVESQDPERRAAVVRSFDHDVVWKVDDDQLPPKMIEVARDRTLRDVARVFTLLKGAAPAVVAHWWEHDPSIPSRTPTSSFASRTSGFEASFLAFEIDVNALDQIRGWSQKFQKCSPKLMRVLRVVLDRLNREKTRGRREPGD